MQVDSEILGTSVPKLKIFVKKLENFKGDLPQYQTSLSSGFDVRAQIDESLFLKPMQRKLIPTGMSFELSAGFEIQVRPRSGLAIKQGLTVLNSPGTIDADYRGEVKVIVINLGEETIEIKDQDRIAQFVLCPVIQADFALLQELGVSARGAGGFVHTGV